MEKYLRPERFEAEPNSSTAQKQWLHWLKTFENFLESIPTTVTVNKYKALVNYVSPNVYEYISEITTYDEAIQKLKDLTHVSFLRIS